jgi:hypothetical protein
MISILALFSLRLARRGRALYKCGLRMSLPNILEILSLALCVNSKKSYLGARLFQWMNPECDRESFRSNRSDQREPQAKHFRSIKLISLISYAIAK